MPLKSDSNCLVTFLRLQVSMPAEIKIVEAHLESLNLCRCSAAGFHNNEISRLAE